MKMKKYGSFDEYFADQSSKNRSIIPNPSLSWSEFGGDPAHPDHLTPLVDQNWVQFLAQNPIVNAESAIGPALGVFRGHLFLVWAGLQPASGGPEQGLVWWSSFDPVLQKWTLPGGVGLRTSRSPSLAVFEDRLFVACRGWDDDANIHWSSFDGMNWDTSELGGLSGVNTNVGTANAPTIATYQSTSDRNPLLYMAWRGVDADENLYWATFDGSEWTNQQQIGGTATSNGPALAVFRNQLYLVWNGHATDSRIWFTVFDGELRDWRPQQQVLNVATNESPAVTVFQDRLYMAWSGLGISNIFWSFFDQNNWALPQMTDALTASGPALAAFDPMLIPYKERIPSQLIYEMKQAAFDARKLVSQALTLGEKTRQLTQEVMRLARIEGTMVGGSIDEVTPDTTQPPKRSGSPKHKKKKRRSGGG
jgi:hypothetical protein